MKKIVTVMLTVMLIMLTACSTNNDSNSQSTNNSEVTATASAPSASNNDTPLENPADQGDMYTLENDGVDPVLFAEALAQLPKDVAQRIVTTSVPLTEMLYLLGITPVGVPTSTNPIPEAFDSVARVGSPMAPDLEVVTNLEPDLLLGAESLRSTLDKNLQGLELTTAYLRTDSFEDLKLSYKVLGTYFNKLDEMNAILSTILAKENELLKLAEGKALPKVMLMIGTSDSFMVMSEGSYLGSLVKKLGADNIANSVLNVEATYSAINLEDVVVADPDIILVLASGDHGANEDKFAQEVEKNAAWKNLSAYKNNKIHILDYSIFGVTSISHVEEALTTVANYFFE